MLSNSGTNFWQQQDASLEVHCSEQMPVSAAGMLYSIDSLQDILQQSHLACAQSNGVNISNIAHLPCLIRILTCWPWRKQHLIKCVDMHGTDAKESGKRHACS